MAAPDHQWVRRLPPGVPTMHSHPKDSKESTGRVPTPDDRQIIRMAQTPSPRAKANVTMHEPVSPPDNNVLPSAIPPLPMPSHYYSSVGQTSILLQPLHGAPPPDRRPSSGPPASLQSHSSGPPSSSHQTNFELDCYVKNRIVEEMRIQEKGGGDRQGVAVNSNQHDRNSTPADERLRPNSGTSAQPYGSTLNPSVATTVAYPYSAWNVSGAPSANHVPQPPSLAGHKVVEHGLNNSNNVSGGTPGSGGGPVSGGGTGPPAEPKPLLSSQYEELSDEEEGNGN